MNIKSFRENDLTLIKEKDKNERIIAYKKYNSIQIIGRNFASDCQSSHS